MDFYLSSDPHNVSLVAIFEVFTPLSQSDKFVPFHQVHLYCSDFMTAPSHLLAHHPSINFLKYVLGHLSFLKLVPYFTTRMFGLSVILTFVCL